MLFYKSKEGKVTVVIRQLVKGCEIFVFDKKLGGKFSINGKEIEKDSNVFLENTTLSEGEEWLRKVGFIKVENN